MSFHGYSMRKKKNEKEKMYSNKDPEEKVSEGVCLLGILTLFGKTRMFALISINKSGQTALSAPQLTATQGKLFQSQ